MYCQYFGRGGYSAAPCRQAPPGSLFSTPRASGPPRGRYPAPPQQQYIRTQFPPTSSLGTRGQGIVTPASTPAHPPGRERPSQAVLRLPSGSGAPSLRPRRRFTPAPSGSTPHRRAAWPTRSGGGFPFDSGANESDSTAPPPGPLCSARIRRPFRFLLACARWPRGSPPLRADSGRSRAGIRRLAGRIPGSPTEWGAGWRPPRSRAAWRASAFRRPPGSETTWRGFPGIRGRLRPLRRPMVPRGSGSPPPDSGGRCGAPRRLSAQWWAQAC